MKIRANLIKLEFRFAAIFSTGRPDVGPGPSEKNPANEKKSREEIPPKIRSADQRNAQPHLGKKRRQPQTQTNPEENFSGVKFRMFVKTRNSV